MNTGLFFFFFFSSSNRIYWAHYQAAYEVIWNEATLKHSTNPLYLVILTLYLNSEHWYGITAAPHTADSIIWQEVWNPKNDISSNFLNHHNNLSERTRYNLGNARGAWLLETRRVQHVLALEEESHINQAAKEPKAVCILRKIDR